MLPYGSQHPPKVLLALALGWPKNIRWEKRLVLPYLLTLGMSFRRPIPGLLFYSFFGVKGGLVLQSRLEKKKIGQEGLTARWETRRWDSARWERRNSARCALRSKKWGVGDEGGSGWKERGKSQSWYTPSDVWHRSFNRIPLVSSHGQRGRGVAWIHTKSCLSAKRGPRFSRSVKAQ